MGGFGYRHFDDHFAALRVHLIPAYTHPIPMGMAILFPKEEMRGVVATIIAKMFDNLKSNL